ncbi:MAG: Gp138 family membrane-puncturing spike protein [Spirochaetota bacterium]
MIAEFIKLFEDFWNNRAKEIIIGAIGRIESHNLATMRADVTPLLYFTPQGTTSPRNFTVIANVPVLFIWAGGYYIRPEYKRGDLVWLSFATFDISKGLSGQADAADGAMFRRESAAVVGGIAKNSWQKPSDITKPGLLVGHKDGNVLLQITDSKIIIKGDIEITGNLWASGEITAKKTTMPVNLSTHTHPTGVGPSGPPNPGT